MSTAAEVTACQRARTGASVDEDGGVLQRLHQGWLQCILHEDSQCTPRTQVICCHQLTCSSQCQLLEADAKDTEELLLGGRSAASETAQDERYDAPAQESSSPCRTPNGAEAVGS